jgi:hypothetical protein
MSRDNARSPMQWNSSPHAGFTTSTPWIAVNPNYREIHVAVELADPDVGWMTSSCWCSETFGHDGGGRRAGGSGMDALGAVGLELSG